MRTILKGSVDRSVDLYIIDSTDGTPEVGVLFNTAGIDLKYRRDLSAVVSITEATLAALTTAHADGGFLEIGNGAYRLDLPDAAWATGADHVTVFGTVTGMIVLPVTVQLVNFDPEVATQKVDVDTIKTNPVVNAGTVTFPTTATLASTTNITAGTITTTTNLTNLPAITANWLTAAGTAADFGAEMATAIWGDTVAGDFTVALSVGKSVMNGVALGTGLTINAYTGNTAQTGDSFARLGAPAGASVSADVATKMATYTQPTGFLAATFPTGTVANTTNITAGTVTTATNLTTNNDKTGYALTTADHIVGADTLLDRNMATGADSGSPTVRTVRQALRTSRNKIGISAGTLTVTKEDDTTASWTATVTTAAGNPISEIDPANV